MSKPIRMELEVEYVRTERIVFSGDLGDGLGQSGLPIEASRFMRLVQYHMHHGKDMVKGEKPRLVRWHTLDVKCICDNWDDIAGATIHTHETLDHMDRCMHCPCSCAPEDAVVV